MLIFEDFAEFLAFWHAGCYSMKRWPTFSQLLPTLVQNCDVLLMDAGIKCKP